MDSIPQPLTTHPAWCDPRRCHTTGTDTQHQSTPIPLHACDAHLTLAWVQADEHAFPDEPGGVEMRVELTHGSLRDSDTLFYLLPEEVHRFGLAWIGEYYRQQAPHRDGHA